MQLKINNSIYNILVILLNCQVIADYQLLHSIGNSKLPVGNDKVNVGNSKQNISKCYGPIDAIILALTAFNLSQYFVESGNHLHVCHFAKTAC